ncbi:MAG: hypothetical protein HWD83_01945 [Gammaproteobacteria bacterium]|nr:hypothetical protein [Gammaproteobacteria bacterium]
MVNSKDNDPVNVPSMRIDDDDRRSTQAAKRGAVARPHGATSKTVSASTTSGKTPIGILVVLGISFVVAITAVVMVYFQAESIQQLNQQLVDIQLASSDQQVRVAAVEAEAEEAHEFANSEIRKLWGVAYDRNRSAIASNTTAIARLETSLASTSSQVQQAARDAGASGSAVEQLQAELASKDMLVNEANQRALLLGEVIEEQQQLMQNMADRISDLERQNALGEAALTQRIDETNEMVQSFNAYRQTVNRQLNELRSQMTGAGAN